MNQYATMIRNLKSPEVMERLMHLYGRRDGMLVEQTGRYIGLLKRHEELFHENREVLMISAPGRTEIGGNHTDHNRGRVLAAAINLDTLSAVSARDDMMVEIHSDGYPAIKVDLGSLDVVEKEKGKTHALVRGVAARMAELGYKIGGFNAAVTSNVEQLGGVRGDDVRHLRRALQWLHHRLQDARENQPVCRKRVFRQAKRSA